eukprot:g7898.t1
MFGRSRTRMMIMESLTVFNLNDVHPAFFTLGHRLAQITKEQELISFLEQVQQERFESLIQCIAHDEEIPDTGVSSSTAESFLSEEEKEGKKNQTKLLLDLFPVLREWKEDIKQVHNPLTDFDLVENAFMEQFGIFEA